MHEWDDYQKDDILTYVDNDLIVLNVIHFFKTESKFIQPIKAYFVAIIYAKCMEKYFGKDFYECLSDPELLFDDPYFVPYTENKEVYDKVVDAIGDLWQYSSITKTVDYFKKEFW